MSVPGVSNQRGSEPHERAGPFSISSLHVALPCPRALKWSPGRAGLLLVSRSRNLAARLVDLLLLLSCLRGRRTLAASAAQQRLGDASRAVQQWASHLPEGVADAPAGGARHCGAACCGAVVQQRVRSVGSVMPEETVMKYQRHGEVLRHREDGVRRKRQLAQRTPSEWGSGLLQWLPYMMLVVVFASCAHRRRGIGRAYPRTAALLAENQWPLRARPGAGRDDDEPP